ncbi:hypothetical protein ATCR1_05906 [Agrobacterium tumefaciens CCNWGS0286]|jgi:hypothetical protein|nr:hypothetical protein ATCR1_05906 [Agrobacterium tumefaciens CCNWGS0286]
MTVPAGNTGDAAKQKAALKERPFKKMHGVPSLKAAS